MESNSKELSKELFKEVVNRFRQGTSESYLEYFIGENGVDHPFKGLWLVAAEHEAGLTDSAELVSEVRALIIGGYLVGRQPMANAAGGSDVVGSGASAPAAGRREF